MFCQSQLIWKTGEVTQVILETSFQSTLVGGSGVVWMSVGQRLEQLGSFTAALVPKTGGSRCL